MRSRGAHRRYHIADPLSNSRNLTMPRLRGLATKRLFDKLFAIFLIPRKHRLPVAQAKPAMLPEALRSPGDPWPPAVMRANSEAIGVIWRGPNCSSKQRARGRLQKPQSPKFSSAATAVLPGSSPLVSLCPCEKKGKRRQHCFGRGRSRAPPGQVVTFPPRRNVPVFEVDQRGLLRRHVRYL